MLSSNSALITALSESTSVKAIPKAVLEYNMNDMAYSVVVTPNTWPATDITKKIFPASSIVKQYRPSRAGIKYYMLGENAPQAIYNNKVGTTVYNDKNVATVKNYIPDLNNIYKYFLTNGNASLTISYKNKSDAAQNIIANKFVIKVETGHSSPTINVGFNGKTVYNSTPPANGLIEVLYNGTTWSTSHTAAGTPDTASSVTVSVTSSGYAGIIEVSPRYVLDISDRIISVSLDKDDSTKESILPVGMLTANSASLELSSIQKNDMVKFIKGDAIVSDKVMLGKDVKCTVSFLINDNSSYLIQQGVYYITTVKENNYDNFSLTCLDGAKFLQEVNCPEIIIKDAPFQSIVWRMLDAAGFNNYDFSSCQSDIFTSLYWWGDKTRTVWQTLQDLCREAQVVAYFDASGVLKFFDRTYFQNQTSAAWTFNYDQDGTKQPDIIELESEINPGLSDVKLTYNIPLRSSQMADSQPLWTEPAPSTLFAGPYMGIETSGSNQYIKYANTGVFSMTTPTRHNSYVLLGGEIIEYDAIQYSTPAGVVDVTSYGDYLDIYAKHSYSVKQTGKLRIKKNTDGTFQRQLFGTSATNATPNNNIASEMSSWNANKISLNKAGTTASTINYLVGSAARSSNISALKLSASTSKDDLYIVSKQLSHADAAIAQVGTAIAFDLNNTTSTGVQQAGGMVISWNPSTQTGYLIHVSSTKSVQNSNDKTEVALHKVVGGLVVKTQALESNIFESGFYGIDVLIKRETGKNTVLLFINGATIQLDDTVDPIPNTSVVGVIVGGQSTAYYDYFYSGARSEFKPDFISSRSRGQLIAKAFFEKFNYSDTVSSQFYYTEFGDVIRELYRGQTDYKQAYPVLIEPTNRLAKVVASRLSAFRGEFFVLNTSSATIPLSTSSGDTLAIYGVSIANAGQNFVEIRDTNNESNQIINIETQWLQTKESVQKLADFLSKFWSKNNIEVNLKVFGNPIIDVGDVVAVKHPDLGYTGTERYLVRAVKHEFENGLSTSVALRSIYLA